ncbi:MAG: DUF3291 domain-containing protein [Pseudomonadota bacterium]
MDDNRAALNATPGTTRKRERPDNPAGDATDVRFGEDPRLLVNLSVWETPEDLERFVFATVHRKFYMRRADWFEKATTPRFVMWPVVAGHRPTVDQAMARLDRLVTDGPSEDAFGWERIADLKLWLKKHCA